MFEMEAPIVWNCIVFGCYVRIVLLFLTGYDMDFLLPWYLISSTCGLDMLHPLSFSLTTAITPFFLLTINFHCPQAFDVLIETVFTHIWINNCVSCRISNYLLKWHKYLHLPGLNLNKVIGSCGLLKVIYLTISTTLLPPLTFTQPLLVILHKCETVASTFTFASRRMCSDDKSFTMSCSKDIQEIFTPYFVLKI